MGINLGAFFSAFSLWFYGFQMGIFSMLELGMLIGLVAFILGQKKYLISEEGKHIGLPVKNLDAKSIGMIIGSIAIIFFMLNFKQMFKSDIKGYY